MTRAEKWKQSPEQVTAARAAKRLMPAWYALTVVVGSTLAMALIAIGIAQHTARETERKFCRVVISEEELSRRPPSDGKPRTPQRVKFAEDMARLRRDLGC